MADRIRVLLVAGDEEHAALVSTRLERVDAGLAVETAVGADEALDRLESDSLNCVVSDYALPDRTGIDLLEAVREERPDLPFILYTADGSEAIASEAISAGVTEYLRKRSGTEQFDRLADRIRDSVDRYRADRRAAAADRNTAIASDVTEALVRATTAEDAERQVCAVLAESGAYGSVGIGGVDDEGGLNFRATATSDDTGPNGGNDTSPNGGGDFTAAGSAIDERQSAAAAVATRAVESGQIVVERVDGPTGSEAGGETAAVPLVAGDGGRGVLVARAAGGGTLDRCDRELLETVGDSVAHSLRSFDTRRRLNAERDRRRALFANAPMPVVEAEMSDDGSHRVIDANAAFERRFGREADEVVGRDIADVIDFPDWTDANRDGERRLASGGLVVEEVVRETVDGPWEFLLTAIPRGGNVAEIAGDDRDIDAGADPGDPDDDTDDPDATPGDDGVADGWYVWYLDIAEQKRRERAIEGLHATVGALVEARTPESVAEITADALHDILDLPYNGVHLYDEQTGGLVPVAWTDETEAIVGEPPTFAPGEGLAGRTYESGEPQVYEDLESASERYNSETPVGSEIVLPLGDHGVLLVGAPERAAFDDIDVSMAKTLAEHATAVLHRIERERILEALQHRTQRLMKATTRDAISEVAVETANGVLGAQLSGVHLLCDGGRRLALAAGADSVETQFDQPPEYVRSDDDPANEVVWNAFDSGEPRYIDDIRTHERLAEQTPSRSVIVYPLADHGVFIVSSTEPNAFDETDKTFTEILATGVAAALDRVERERELRRRNEHLDEFAGLISHDLRNPLNVAQGRVELAREETDSDHLDPAARSINRALSLLEESLAFAREGRDEADFEPVNLATAAVESWSHLDTGDAELAVETTRTVTADASRLKQVLENLIGNAVKHGGDGVTVTVGDLPTGFYVADDGPGIPPDSRGDVFEVGYSSDDGSTGYGLYIVSRIVDAHGWEIAVVDADAADGTDGGVRFEITGVDPVA
ncbi:GAF domain-containing protein [Halobaculum gomorrense]|uniref:histidine kinase n=1 Tax=Halobaculum gomorrense TaxID=43928 RepID=A0A1M5NWK4_9EURY|nr:GAF domain-containing protein [Halobaculum gomorrense]SHG93974.1 PAS domain S-box-containing protein [Halobaculum gomorrense]